MLQFLLPLLLLTAPVPVPGGNEEQASAPETALVRTTITVSDMERSRRFYVDGLGFRATFEGDITTDSTRILLGLRPGQRARFLVLKNTQAVGGKPAPATGIGLLFLSGDTGSPVGTRGIAPAAGQAMLAIETSDIAETERRLRGVGAHILVGPLTSHQGEHREIVLHDPDGVRIHVVQVADANP